MVKDVQIYFIRLKNDLFGCFRIEKIRDQDNETDLKEERVIQIETYSASIHYNNNYNLVCQLQCFPYYAMHALFRFCIYLPPMIDFVKLLLAKISFLGSFVSIGS